MVTVSKSGNRLAAPGHGFRCALSDVLSSINQFAEKNS